MFASSLAPALDCDVDGDWGAYADRDMHFDVDVDGDVAMWAAEGDEAEMGEAELCDSSRWDADQIDAQPVGELLNHMLTLSPDEFVMNALARIDRRRLSDVDAVSFLQLHQRVAAWWASVQAEVVLVAASPEPMMREGIVLAMNSDEERTVWIEE